MSTLTVLSAVAGQHAGDIGEIADIDVQPGSADNTVSVDTDDGGFETVEDYVVVIDENFVEGEDDESESRQTQSDGGDDE